MVQNNQQIVISFNTTCISGLYCMNIFLSWSGIALIVTGFSLISFSLYYEDENTKQPGVLECGVIVLSVSIALLIVRCIFVYLCLEIKDADNTTEVIETNSGQQPNISNNVHSEQENRVILIFTLGHG